MSTRSERKALLFLGVVAFLGGAVRVMQARTAPPAQADRRALDARMTVAAGRGETAASGRRVGQGRGAPVTSVVRGVVPKPPKPRMASDSVAPPRRTKRPAPSGPPAADREHPVDVDRATAAELMTLPGIGPALAQRIIAYRDSAGAFGSLDRLGSVRGIGPAILRRLDTLVRFSGIPRSY